MEPYPVQYPDRPATFSRNSPLLTQFDGMGMMELLEQEQRELVERQKGRHDPTDSRCYRVICPDAQSIKQKKIEYTS